MWSFWLLLAAELAFRSARIRFGKLVVRLPSAGLASCTGECIISHSAQSCRGCRVSIACSEPQFTGDFFTLQDSHGPPWTYSNQDIM